MSPFKPGGGTTRTMAQAAGTTPLSIATEPAFQSALQAATGNETDIAKLHTKHISDFGGYYLADVSLHVPAPVLVPAPVPAHVP